MTLILSVANVQRYDNDATHVGLHGKGIEVVVILIVSANLRDNDPLDEGMQETACEEDPGVVFIFVAGRRRRHGRMCCLGRSSQRPMVLSTQVREPQAERLVSNSVSLIDRPPHPMRTQGSPVSFLYLEVVRGSHVTYLSKCSSTPLSYIRSRQ